MKKFIAILSLVLILIGISCLEEIFLNNFIYNISKKSNELSIIVEQNEEYLNTSDVENAFKNLETYWNKSKIPLCYFTNYEKIRSVDESFVKLSAGIKNNDKSLVNENVAIIKNSSNLFSYIMGFNINNLF